MIASALSLLLAVAAAAGWAFGPRSANGAAGPLL
ncbi:MAG: hypothetical protein JWO31_422, partial [Phycisphaerales bacterium]|nr:hypothetical protein [Phycisphaerales bacterium]